MSINSLLLLFSKWVQAKHWLWQAGFDQELSCFVTWSYILLTYLLNWRLYFSQILLFSSTCALKYSMPRFEIQKLPSSPPEYLVHKFSLAAATFFCLSQYSSQQVNAEWSLLETWYDTTKHLQILLPTHFVTAGWAAQTRVKDHLFYGA